MMPTPLSYASVALSNAQTPENFHGTYRKSIEMRVPGQVNDTVKKMAKAQRPKPKLAQRLIHILFSAMPS
jgi:hypothetical protein